MLNWLRKPRLGGMVYPPAPANMVIYAVGDIHGRLDCLNRAHAMIDQDRAKRPRNELSIEVYLGDYIDRGPDTKGVIDRLLSREAEAKMFLLRGNHEIMMTSFLDGQSSFEPWRAVGGLETALSYGLEARALLSGGANLKAGDLLHCIPPAHVRFLRDLGDFAQFGSYIFVHAGLRPGIALADQSLPDLTGIRDDFLNFRGDFGMIVIHGHTPVPEVEFLANRVNIDTGAYITNRLSVLRVGSSGISVLESPRI